MDRIKKIIAKLIDAKKNNQLSVSLKNQHEIPQPESDAGRPSRSSKTRIVQNFRLIWLDNNIDPVNDNDCDNTIVHLREVVNYINTFSDADECVDFITDIKDEKIFMISSGSFGERTVPILQEISQVSAIYIFCRNKSYHEEWAQQWSKVKGVFADIKPVCVALKQAVQECDQNSISISFIAPDGTTTNQNLDQLDQSFMYTQLLKEILLTIDFEQKHVSDFISYCREQFAKNTMELKNIDKFEREYYQYDPVWWYTYPCFLYSMLNRALRMMEVDLIITMGFFIRQLHQRMVQLHLIQYTGHNHSKSFTVYRGQGLSQTDFDQLMKTKGGLLSFNNFLSTSADRQESLKFSRETIRTSSLVGIVFVMKIDPSVSSITFANVRDISYCPKEQEILFSTHSIFRIGEIKKLEENGRLWEVELTLTSDNDSQLAALTECIREETFTGYKGWYRLGYLLIKLGQFDKSEQLYDIMLDKTTDDDHEERLFIYHMLAMIKDNQGQYAEAITFYKKSIEIKRIILSPTDLSLASSYNNIGLVYEKMKKYSKALLSHTKALRIREKFLSPNHLDLAQSYACHGSVYDSMGEYSIALSYYDKAHEIYQKVLLKNHSDLATSYDNIGKVFNKIGEYSKALSCQQTALDIRQKILPRYHPVLATSYYNIGSVFSRMGDDEKALSFYERALDIGKRSLAANHPHLRLYKNKVETKKNENELLCVRL